MSLVAYASSDGESESDETDTTEKDSSINQTSKYLIRSNCEASVNNSSDKSSGQTDDKDDHISDSDSEHPDPEVSEDDINEGLKALPQPKTGFSTTIKEDDVLEEEVKPKSSQLKDAPKPPPKKTKQPARFTISAQYKDLDEEEPVAKKSETSNSRQGKSGLFSLLPPPIHAAKKETNRILIPHSLSKKTSDTKQHTIGNTSSTNSKSVSSSQKLHSMKDYGSDSDEESPSSFFSLDTTEKSEERVLPEPPSDFKTNRLTLPPPVRNSYTSNELTSGQSKNLFQSSQPVTHSVSDSISMTPQHSTFTTNSMQMSDEPLKFNSRHSSLGPNFSYSQTVNSKLPRENTYTPVMEYHNYYQEDNTKYPYSSQAEENTEADNLGISEQELLRLQGKRRKGKEEINFVDVSADDYTDPSEIQKHLSEEQTYQSHKKKDGPTSTQKRKHQITYLAHQAKERELELKNQWSQNRMTRKQTQAKYGF